MRASLFALLLAGCVVGADGNPADAGPDLEGDHEDGDLVDPAAATSLTAGCASTTSVLLYAEESYALALPGAFARVADRCTRYYVDLPHVAADKTMPRDTAAQVRALGPGFHAMAEFSWSGWAEWIAASPGTRTWTLAAKAFRGRMRAAGYDVAAGDTWVINEFPASTRTGEGEVWAHEREAVAALGADDGTGTGTTQGVVFMAGMGQPLQNFAVYKPALERWLQQDAWWTDMARSVRFFSYEVYADPHTDCVPGSNVAANAEHLNDFLEHVPRLAAAGGSRTAIASAYLARAFVPLLSAAWNSSTGFGDNRIGFADFEKYLRLQVYGTHAWAANHGFPGRRIGFAWSPREATPAQLTGLADTIARSVSRSYPAGGFHNLGKLACSTDGSLAGCGCTVAVASNPGWQTFATW